MRLIKLILDLSEPDVRFGDALLMPQRYAVSRWARIISPLDASMGTPWQVGARIAEIAFLLLFTLPSYAVACVGIILKACSPLNDLNLGRALPPLNNRFALHCITENRNVFQHMVTFLPEKEQWKMLRVSKGFDTKISTFHVIWDPYLKQERIWGGSDWRFSYKLKEGYVFEATVDRTLDNPLKQYKMYRTLCNNRLAGEANGFYDYMARLMPEGPLGFNAIPEITPPDAVQLLPNEMNAPLARGKDQRGSYFFALRVLDRSLLNAAPVALVFRNSREYDLRHISDWEQVANNYWPQNNLKISNQTTLNYILALIRREDLKDNEDFFLPCHKRSIELV